MKCLMNYRYVAKLFAMIGATSSRYIYFFGHTAPQLAANSPTSNLPTILTRLHSTAELRVVGIETSCTQPLIEEPTPDSNDLAMSCLRIR